MPKKRAQDASRRAMALNVTIPANNQSSIFMMHMTV